MSICAGIICLMFLAHFWSHSSEQSVNRCPTQCVCNQEGTIQCQGLHHIPEAFPIDAAAISLRNNDIHQVNHQVFQNLRALRSIDLEDNPLICDCNMIRLIDISNERRTTLSVRGHCHSPSNLKGRSIATLNVRDMNCERPKIIKDLEDVEIDERKAAMFHCSAIGKPEPTIEWRLNRVPVLNKSNKIIVSDPNIRQVQCIASNIMGQTYGTTAIIKRVSPSHNTKINIFPRSEMLILHKPPQAISVERGSTLRIQCSPVPPARVQWLFHNERISTHSDRHFESETTGLLMIQRTSERDSGIYECHAKLNNLSQFATVNVTIVVPVKFLEWPIDVTTVEHNSAEFRCVTEGFPKPSIAWFKDGIIIDGLEKTRFKTISNAKVLRVSNVSKSDQGTYACIAKNLNYSIEAVAELHVIAQAAPQFVYGSPNTIKYMLGSKMRLVCIFVAEPPATVQWFKDSILLGEGGASLNLDSLKREDAAVYTCVGRNHLGSSEYNIHLGFLPENTKPSMSDLNKTDELSRLLQARSRSHIRQVLNDTLREIFYRNNSQMFQRFLQVFLIPDAQNRQRDIAADTIEMSLHIITNISENHTISVTPKLQKSSEELFTVHMLKYLEEKSGCLRHRTPPYCLTCTRFRTIDGTCNNLKNPLWGASATRLNRLLPSNYANNFGTPKGWIPDQKFNGYVLPLARLVSTTLINSPTSVTDVAHDPQLTHMVMQWGQFLDHDIDFSMPTARHERFFGPVDCRRTCHNEAPCIPIPIPPNDPRIRGHRCIEFVRSATSCDSDRTSLFYGMISPREQVNELTSYVDASNVYGSDKKRSTILRNLTSPYGLLKVGIVANGTNKPLLPTTIEGFPNDCRRNPLVNVECMFAGDMRANEQLGLTAMHTLWLRQHNRIAMKLHEINGHWSSDRLYQESRKIIGALMQHITYTQWLPNILGRNKIKDIFGEYKAYNESVDASVLNAFSTAAMRFGHFIINPVLHRLDKHFREIPQGHLMLRRAFFAPHVLINDGGIDSLLRGLFMNPAKRKTSTDILTVELTQHLFELGLRVPFDLAAINIQRGRDHGLPSYNEYRSICGLQKAQTMDQFSDEIHDQAIRAMLEKLYRTPDNVDLWVGGVLENNEEGSVVGPTFHCILSAQFKRLRDGDRFWYENRGVFTSDQLIALKNSGGLSRVLCDSGDDIDRVTRNPFVRPELNNEPVSCTQIDSLNLNSWKDTFEDNDCTKV